MAASYGLAQILELLEEVGARLVNGDVLGPSTASIQVGHLAPLGVARSQDCAFFFSKGYQQELLTAAPGILITGEPFVGPMTAQASVLPFWKKTALVACRDPYFAMALLSEVFAKETSTVAHLPGGRTGQKTTIHPSAVVDPTAQIEEGAQIGPHCVIEAGARIGRGSVLYPRVYVGPAVEIGEDTVLFPGVTLYEWTKLGRRVRIHAGATLGADGFGYAPKSENGVPVGHQKIYHFGRVVVGDDVEIGANSMVDRATFGETRIDAKVKIDNHVHIGHNSVIHEGAILCGCSALAGGTTIGKYVYVGGMAAIGNKAKIGDFAKIGGMSLIDKDVPSGSMAVGNPQRTHRDHFKAHAILNRLVAERDRKGRKKNEEN